MDKEETRHRDTERRMEQLTTAVEGLLRLQARPRPTLKEAKAPQYDGQGDVGFFIREFQEVVAANHWNEGTALIQLRHTLKDTAKNCGEEADLNGVFQALQARFGLNPREARTTLEKFRRDGKKTFHEYARALTRLVEVAFSQVSVEGRREIVMENYLSKLNDPHLQRHLMAFRPTSLEEAVTESKEYCKIATRPGTGVQSITESGARPVRPLALPEDPVVEIQKQVVELVKQVAELQQQKLQQMQVRGWPTQWRTTPTNSPFQAGNGGGPQ